MKATMLYGKGDVRYEDVPEPENQKADRRHHPGRRGLRLRLRPLALPRHQRIVEPMPMGHEYCGVIEEVGSDVVALRCGQFVVGSFFASDNVCPVCTFGYPSSCQNAEFVGGAQAPLRGCRLAQGIAGGGTRNAFC